MEMVRLLLSAMMGSHNAFIMLTRLIDSKVKSFNFSDTMQEVLLITDQRNQDNRR